MPYLKPREDRICQDINGNPGDNRPENLQVVANRAEHNEIHYLAERIGLSVVAAENWMPTVEGMAC